MVTYLGETHQQGPDEENQRVRLFAINEFRDAATEELDGLCVVCMCHGIGVIATSKSPMGRTLCNDQLQQEITGKCERHNLNKKWIDWRGPICHAVSSGGKIVRQERIGLCVIARQHR